MTPAERDAQMRYNLAAVGIHLDPTNSRFDSQGTNTVATEAENAALRHRLNKMEQQLAALQRPRPDDEAEAIGVAQARADSVAQQFGNRASPPIAGETALQYRRRMIGQFQKYSPRMADARLDGCNSAALGAVEDVVYTDAQTAARRGDGLAGRLIEHKYLDSAGRTITEFSGDPMAWMGQFMTSGRVGHFDRANASRKG
jgi:hypothetical protein